MTNDMSPAGSDLLTLKGLYASNQKSAVLKNINFSLRPGEIHALLSTSEFLLQKFLDAMAGAISVTAGTLLILGEETEPGQAFVKKGATFVCQDTQLFSGFSALDNIFIRSGSYFSHSFLRRTRKTYADKVREQFGVDFDLMRDVSALNAEERKIVELLRAYYSDFKIILLHDTFNTVGTSNIALVKKIMAAITSQGKGIIYATTDLEDVLTFSSRISVLDEGTIKSTYYTADAASNLRDLIGHISGWERISSGSIGEEYINEKVYSVLVHSRELIASSYELKYVIHALSEDFRNALSASGCVVYLINEETNGIIASCYPEEQEVAPRLTTNFILSRCSEKHGMLFNTSDPGYEDYFVNGSKGAEAMMCVNVFSNDRQVGFIQIWYNWKEIFSAKSLHFMNSFAREVSIAVETSKLMGRSVLLQESDHRIKNNLQMVINLVYMQKAELIRKQRTDTGDVSMILDSVIDRIKSIAIVHDMFSFNRLGQNYFNLRKLVSRLLQQYEMMGVDFTIDIDEIGIPYSAATSVALIINELVSNCFKHAFGPDEEEKRISISCHRTGNRAELSVSDNGRGFPAGFDPEDNSSLGFSIVSSIVESLSGELEFSNQNGSVVKVLFPMGELYNMDF